MGVQRLRSSISISVVVHVFLFFACALLIRQRAAEMPHQTWIEIQTDRVEKTAEAEKSEQNRRIVQTERASPTEKVPDQVFLGERNQVTDHQTVNKDRAITMAKSPSAAIEKAQRETAKILTEFQRATQLNQLGLPVMSLLRQKAAQPVRDEPRWAEASQTPQDYIKGIKESERTVLNTKEYVFYGYYQRIRERLDRAWVPILREKLVRFYHAGRQLASDMDHSTRVLVVLNNRGEIVRVQVLSESGTQDLDEAAISAFNRAGPFPNPPKGIVDTNGEIQIPWEFILKT